MDRGGRDKSAEQARRNKVLVILDLQPGRGNFLPQAQRLERFLIQPHVGLALDPEWRMPPGKVPGRTIGSGPAPGGQARSGVVSRVGPDTPAATETVRGAPVPRLDAA